MLVGCKAGAAGVVKWGVGGALYFVMSVSLVKSNLAYVTLIPKHSSKFISFWALSKMAHLLFFVVHHGMLLLLMFSCCYIGFLFILAFSLPMLLFGVLGIISYFFGDILVNW